jgi:hypothetical protein
MSPVFVAPPWLFPGNGLIRALKQPAPSEPALSLSKGAEEGSGASGGAGMNDSVTSRTRKALIA